MDVTEFRKRMHRVEELLQQVESFPDPVMRAHVGEIVRTLMDFHGIGLERILDHVAESGVPGAAIIENLAQDEIAGSLLLLYGLHPSTLEERVRQALVKVRPQLAAHGGSVQLLSLSDSVVRLKLEGSCHGCPSSAITLKQTIEEAIVAAAPEIVTIEVADESHHVPLPTEPVRGRMDLPLVNV